LVATEPLRKVNSRVRQKAGAVENENILRCMVEVFTQGTNSLPPESDEERSPWKPIRFETGRVPASRLY